MKQPVPAWTLVAALLLSLATLSPAWAITYIPRGAAAYFEGGEGSVDTWTGAAGDGWAGAWATKKGDSTGAALTCSLTNASPLVVDPPGTNNYVSASLDAAAANDYVTIGRKYDTTIAIDPTQDYTISFLFRVDENLDTTFGTFFTSTVDRYQLYQSKYNGLNKGSGSNDTWSIHVFGGDQAQTTGDQHTIPAGNWFFNDYVGDGTSTNYKWDTGIHLTQGVAYAFQVTVHPNYKWDATISDGTTSFTKANMGFRNNSRTTGYVEFFGKASDDADVRQFSVDSLVVSQSGSNWVGGMNQVAARFNDGNSTTAVDAYAGMAGNGWNTAWQTKVNDADYASITPTVVTSSDLGYNPIKAGTGNYLQMVAQGGTNASSSNPGQAGVGRDYGCINANGIDWTKKHTVSFTVRIDEDLSTFTGFYDRYQFVDAPAVAASTGSSCTWEICAFGNTGTGITEDMVRQWVFIDGSSTYVDSNIDLTAGGVYDFTVVIDPSDKTYDVSVSNGATTASFADLAWHAPAAQIGAFVSFATTMDTVGEQRICSIDDLVVFSQSIPGDANNDGYVNAADATILASNWGRTNVTQGAAWGDFNGDLAVDAADAAILAANWTGAAERSGAVPEPTVLATLLGAIVWMAVTWRGWKD